MASEVSETLIKVQSETPKSLLRMKIAWTESYFTLTIIEKTNAWSTHISLEQVNKQANVLEMHLKDYYKDLKQYFFETPQDVTFNIVKNELHVFRTVNNSMKIKYFSAPLKKADYSDCVEKILDEIHEKNLNLQNKLLTVEKEVAEALNDKEKCEVKLKEFVEAKEKHDTQLMSNFLLLLNEKKKRIQHLTEMLDVYKTNKILPNASQNVLKKKRSKKKINNNNTDEEDKKMLTQVIENVEKLSTSESEEYKTDDDETDDEKNVKQEVQSRDLTENEPIPSTSKEPYNFFLEDDAPSIPIAKRVKVEMPHKTFDVEMNNGENTNGLTKPTNNKKDEKIDINRDSPVLDFNTQDLLDRL